ncbi:MAG: hypothetical protein HYY40_06430 [Bacteroidetes bacterium]|nr:hypothetical protein [Bacteroidota bacterium]
MPEIVKEKEAAPSPVGEACPEGNSFRGRGGAVVIVSAWYQYRPFTYYYNREYFRDYENTIELLRKDNIHCIDKADGLAKVNLAPFSKIILVQSHRPVADPENTLYKYFNENYNLLKSTSYEGIKVSVLGK